MIVYDPFNPIYVVINEEAIGYVLMVDGLFTSVGILGSKGGFESIYNPINGMK